MITIEQVEKLRQYGNISFEDAKSALEQTDGNILDAIILLEKEGKISPPEQGGSYSADKPPKQGHSNYEYSNYVPFGTHFKNFIKWIGRIIHKGNINTMNVTRKGELIISLPITILVILSLCCFWVVFPLIIVGMFFNLRYAFSGPDLGKDSINNIVNSVADAADGIKNSVKDAVNEDKDRKDTDN